LVFYLFYVHTTISTVHTHLFWACRDSETSIIFTAYTLSKIEGKREKTEIEEERKKRKKKRERKKKGRKRKARKERKKRGRKRKE
jgi:hypothetical protein